MDQLICRMVRINEASRIVGRSRSTIYRDIEAGRFPSPVRIGLRAVAFRSTDIDAWLANPAGYRASDAVA